MAPVPNVWLTLRFSFFFVVFTADILEHPSKEAFGQTLPKTGLDADHAPTVKHPLPRQ